MYFVYILANKKFGTLYVGVTNDLSRRIEEHHNNYNSSTGNYKENFTQRYQVHKLVYYELHEDIYAAIQREKRLKKWLRAWKIELIESNNPNWEDLSHTLH